MDSSILDLSSGAASEALLCGGRGFMEERHGTLSGLKPREIRAWLVTALKGGVNGLFSSCETHRGNFNASISYRSACVETGLSTSILQLLFQQVCSAAEHRHFSYTLQLTPPFMAETM